jgi:hypothetical protein
LETRFFSVGNQIFSAGNQIFSVGNQIAFLWTATDFSSILSEGFVEDFVNVLSAVTTIGKLSCYTTDLYARHL